MTGTNRWCVAWAHRRDLALAGRVDEALASFPVSFPDLRPSRSEGSCVSEKQAALLGAVLEAERGDLPSATRRVGRFVEETDSPRPDIALVQDARQHVWRFAGDLPMARKATRDWQAASAEDFLAFDRQGEIDYLAGDLAAAVEAFRRARSLAPSHLREAEEALKLGASLARGGRHEEARTELAAADRLASDIVALAYRGRDGKLVYDEDLRALYLSYNARLQIGDNELRAGRFDEALVAYLLSAVAAGVYLVATVALWRGARRLAYATVLFELVGVLVVGTLTVVDAELFPDQTVWSAYGAGYGFIPLVLPVLGLWRLRATR